MSRPRKLNNNPLTSQNENDTLKNQSLNNSPSDNSSSVKAPTIKRRKRISLQEQRRQASIPNKDPDFHYRWVNDKNVEMVYWDGYELVDRNGHELDVDERIQDPAWRQSALSQKTGSTTAYCMKIPLKTWEKNQKEKLAKRDENYREKINTIEGVPKSLTYGEVKLDHHYEK